jgi:hypothetical protein
MSASVTRRIIVVFIVSLMSWGVVIRASADPGRGEEPARDHVHQVDQRRLIARFLVGRRCR